MTPPVASASRRGRPRRAAYAWTLVIVALCTAVTAVATPLVGLGNADALYLLAVVVVAARYGRGPAILASLLGVLALDYFIVPPPYGFVPEDAASLVTFAVMLAVALMVSVLATHAQQRMASADAAHRAELAAEQERLRNTLLRSVSHDLRTPVAAIRGAASTLLQSDVTLDPDTRRQLLRSMDEASQRLARQIHNLLEVTRLEAGVVRLRLEWTPLDEVVGAALTDLEERLRGRLLRVDLPDELPPLPLDGLLAQQVIMNLMDNAMRHTPPGTPIELTAHAEGGEVIVEVRDRGPGIPAGEEQHVFDKFHRLERNASTLGTGLGLAIARAIMELHHGRIWVEAREGGGATFCAAFPCRSPELVESGPDPAAAVVP